MNKTAVLACAALFAAGLSANAAEVVSSNTVGYQKITLNPGYTMIGIPFVEVGTGNALGILDMFENFEGATAAASFSAADQIQVWNGEGYDFYYYRKTKAGNVWNTEANKAVSDETIPNGGAFYLAQSAVSFQLKSAGEVSTESTTFTIVPGYNLIANPFPADLKVSSLVADGQTAAASFSAADQIQVWNGEGYDFYYFRKTKTGNVWNTEANKAVTDDDVLPSGSAFFYLSQGVESFTLTVESPIAPAVEL